ncbi:putative DNA ligase-like protein/MT0965 [Variibacter gotjawalensis]|uniref:DNA ligase (ATP) n=1 Tax=Variibacter gotjawalensis TaxID=1333996 RepID=A0A0S3PUB8_9BRAD|nr:hypothetical protein [Variibacter gotjawalensis]NIK49813.1 ATP-dependent DNA ligase [Variibacter gotjawalensis]BAT59490.1 putative DNA ligase-like protein/MT0965 [Variibacter gotjawalensis]
MGRDLRGEWLTKRKAALSAVIPTVITSPVKFVEWIEKTDGAQVVASACDLGLEGVVSKLADAPYRSGDKTDWVKVKCSKRAEYVIVGYVPSTRGRGVEALRLARKNGRKLDYVGKVGTGFSAKSGAEVRAKLEPLMRAAAALSKPIDKPGTVWVEPTYTAQIEYLQEVEGGLRHASIKGIVS